MLSSHEQGVLHIDLAAFPLLAARALAHSSCEQQVIGDVLVADCGLLGEVCGPAEEFQDRADQLLFGHRFVGFVVARERVECLADALPERCEILSVGNGRPPFGRGPYAVGQEVVGEKLPWHVESRREI